MIAQYTIYTKFTVLHINFKKRKKNCGRGFPCQVIPKFTASNTNRLKKEFANIGVVPFRNPLLWNGMSFFFFGVVSTKWQLLIDFQNWFCKKAPIPESLANINSFSWWIGSFPFTFQVKKKKKHELVKCGRKIIIRSSDSRSNSPRQDSKKYCLQ